MERRIQLGLEKIGLKSIQRQWTVFGVLFGCLFPIFALFFELQIQDLAITIENFLVAHNTNQILWIVDLAPFVLGFAFNLVGQRELKSQQSYERLKGVVQDSQKLQSNLEKMVEERTAQLKAINEVGRVATSILDPDELINRVVHLITEEFGYYYAAIFLIDQSNKWAELKDATGEAGRVLKESQLRLELDGTNVIGRTIQSRQAQILTDTGDKSFHLDYPLLPYTRSEISLPLYVSDRILGVLDVHSTKEFAFSDQDIETLQNMANQVAISLDNARLFQETRQNLHEMRSIQKQYLHEAWIDTSIPRDDISLVAGASSVGEIKNLVEVPVMLRDQIIGQLSLESDEALSLDEKNWIQEIATQTALALENARLVEESQSAAMREKFVTEIINKIWASMSIDGVLQTAVRELGQILDATEATIEIDVTGE
jgi:GAF domain-containing protein